MLQCLIHPAAAKLVRAASPLLGLLGCGLYRLGPPATHQRTVELRRGRRLARVRHRRLPLPSKGLWNFAPVGLAVCGIALSLPAVAPAAFAEERQWRIIETYGYEAAEPAEGAARGKQVYEQWCIICHDAGPGMAGTSALKRRYQGKLPALLTEREDLAAEYISLLVRQGVKSMPFFRKTEIGDEDLAALNLYLAKPPAED